MNPEIPLFQRIRNICIYIYIYVSVNLSNQSINWCIYTLIHIYKYQYQVQLIIYCLFNMADIDKNASMLNEMIRKSENIVLTSLILSLIKIKLDACFYVNMWYFLSECNYIFQLFLCYLFEFYVSYFIEFTCIFRYILYCLIRI